MPTATPQTLHGLRILSPQEAASQGFKSITTTISSLNEKTILANVAKDRSPHRSCFILMREDLYELAILREDFSNLSDPLTGGFLA